MPNKRASRRNPKPPSFPMNLLGGLGTVLTGLFKLLGKGLNAIGIVLLALVELLVKVLQQSAGLALKALKALLELISAILVGATKPFGGLVGRKQGSKGSSAAKALGWVGGAVIVFFFASMISVLLPALFSNPGWYAGVLRGFVGNGGLLIFGLFCLCMAQTWPDGHRTRETSRGRNTWLGRMAAILYLLVLPGFTYISVLTWKQVDTNTRDQQAVLRQRRDEGLRQIAIASNPAPLRQLIQASGSPQPPPAASLASSTPVSISRMWTTSRLDTSRPCNAEGTASTTSSAARTFISAPCWLMSPPSWDASRRASACRSAPFIHWLSAQNCGRT